MECEVGYAKWPIYIGIPRPTESALLWITTFKVGINSIESESSECPFCPFCPSGLSYLSALGIPHESCWMRSGLCEVAHIHRYSSAVLSGLSDLNAVGIPHEPFWMRSGLCEVAQINPVLIFLGLYITKARFKALHLGSHKLSIRVHWVYGLSVLYDFNQCVGDSTQTLALIKDQSSIIRNVLCEVAYIHKHSRPYTQRVVKSRRLGWLELPLLSSECPVCPICPVWVCPFWPISMRWAFHTNLNQSSINRNGLCEAVHMHRHSRACIQHVRKHFIWVGTMSPSEFSECPFCPFCPISMRWAFHTNLNQQSSIMLSGLCEVAHLYRHSMADTKHLRKHFI